jgi:hypothetical protein
MVQHYGRGDSHGWQPGCAEARGHQCDTERSPQQAAHSYRVSGERDVSVEPWPAADLGTTNQVRAFDNTG